MVTLIKFLLMGILNRGPKPPGSFSDNGFVRDRGEDRGVRVHLPKPSDLARPDPIAVQERLSELAEAGPYSEAVKPLKARQTKLAVMGIPAAVLGAGDPRYARCVKLAQSWKKTRQKEMYIAYGFVSAGVGALLASAGLALSASRLLYEVAAESPIQPQERGHLGMPQLLKLASSLGDSARQNELAAWELCAKEAVINDRNVQKNKDAPWIVPQTQQVTGADGEVKRPRGRPRKAVPLALPTEGDANAGPGEELFRETEGICQEGSGED